MALPALHARRWSHRQMRVLSSVLAAAVLLPVSLLVVELWQDLADRKSFAAQELHGIEYARALTNLTAAVTAIQSAEVGGRPMPGDDLAAAVAAMAAADDRYGEELRVRERWNELRPRIEGQTTRIGRTARAAFHGHGESTDMLLDFGDRLRDTSGLIRDVDDVVYYLQDTGIEELPEAVVAAGRLVDLVVMAATRPPIEQAAADTEISVARVELVSPVRELEFNLQSAMESAGSRSLDGAMIGLLDRFVRATDNILAAVPVEGRVIAVDMAAMTALWQEFLTAAADLQDMLLNETESLVSARLAELDRAQLTTAVAVALVLLLTLGVLLSNVAAGRREAADGSHAPDDAVRPEAVELTLAVDAHVPGVRGRSGVR